MSSQADFKKLLSGIRNLKDNELHQLQEAVSDEMKQRNKPKSVEEMIERTIEENCCEKVFRCRQNINDEERLMKSDINPLYIEEIKRIVEENDTFQYKGEVWNIEKIESHSYSSTYLSPRILDTVRFYVKKCKISE